MLKMNNGYIYCVSTPSNNDRCKVGETLSGIEFRLYGLNNTSVSENFKLDYYIVVDSNKRFKIEKLIHTDIITAGYTRFPGKEFFKCKPTDIKHIFEKYGNIYTSINEHDNSILSNYQCSKCLKKFKKKSAFDCHMSRKYPCVKDVEIQNKCTYCNKIYSTKYNLKIHQNSCKSNIVMIDHLDEINKIKHTLVEQEKKIIELIEINKMLSLKYLA
jgi:hypothetical protein